MKSVRIVLLILSLIIVQSAASEECTDITLVWGERVSVDAYRLEVTDFSIGSMSEIVPGESVWALITIYKNDSVVWRDVFSTNQTVANYFYDANESAYTFDLNCTRTYYENGTDRIRIHASKIVIGSIPETQKIDVRVCVIEPPPPPISLEEWMNNTFSMTKSVSTEIYVREKAFIEIEITNISMADRIEITDSIPGEFVIDPDRDLYWNYSAYSYRYSMTSLVPGKYTLPAANASIWYHGHLVNITSNTPDIDVHGPYITITKTAEPADGIANVTVSASNTGDHAAVVYVFDSIPDGSELLEGVLNFSAVLNPAETGYTSEYVNRYTIKINNSVVLPRAVAYYQTSKQVDVSRSYRPEATPGIEKYINPKFYAGRSRSEEITITYGNDTEPILENTSEDIQEDTMQPTGTPDETPTTINSTPQTNQTPLKEKKGIVQKIKKIPGFGSLFTVIGLLTGYLILRNHDVI